MLVKTYTLFSLILLFSFKCLSQTNYQPGFYITLDNDTIHGLINDRSGVGNYIHCIFKPYKSSKSQKLSPEEIQSYQFQDGRYFLSKNIYVDSVKRQVFVEFLVDGISDLFLYRDKEHYFYVIENANGETIELQKEEVTDWSDPTQHDPYFHIRKLKVAFADCMEIQPQVEQADFSNKSLIKLTRDYHNYVCDEYECIVYEKRIGPPQIYIAPVIGISKSSLSFDKEFYSNFTYEDNQNFNYGIQVDFVLAFINDRMSVQALLLYGKNDYKGTYNNYYELDVMNHRLQGELLFKYTFPFGMLRPSLGFGMHNDFIRNASFFAVVDNNPGNPPNETYIDTIFMRYNLFGGVLQAGMNFRIFGNREFFTNFRYTYSDGITNGPSEAVTTRINAYNINFGFYLNKVR